MNRKDSEDLVRVGPGTVMGGLMRQYWLPAAMSSELQVDGAPQRLMLLGEQLIAFRDSNGRIGILDEFCAHRRASLFWGRNEECSLRCVFHGWKYDACGRCVEQPFESPEVKFKDKIQHPAYPVVKLAGLLFAYMGPPEKKPILPKWDLLVRQDGVKKVDICEVLRCNWLQAMENSVDPTHTYYLHSHNLKLKGAKDYVPFHYQQLSKFEFELVVQPTWVGIQKQRVFAGRGVAVGPRDPGDHRAVARPVLKHLLLPAGRRRCERIDPEPARHR